MRANLCSALVPALLAAAVIGFREVRAPAALAAPAAPTQRTVELPTPAYAPRVDPTRSHVLDAARSIARFQVEGRFDHFVALTPHIVGELGFAEDGAPLDLRLEIDLFDLLDEDRAPLAADQWRLLGVAAGSTVRFSGRASATRKLPVPGVSEVTWSGRVTIGTHVRHVDLCLWMATTVPGKVRLQGVGTVLARDFGLPQRYVLGLLPEQNRIMLGLDLQFRAATGN